MIVTAEDGEFVIPVDGLAEEMGVDLLRDQMASARTILNQLEASVADISAMMQQVVDYMNRIDLRIQRLDGEPIVTSRQKPHIDGRHISFATTFPAIPDKLPSPKTEAFSKMVTTDNIASKGAVGLIPK